ncbi:MAG: hypothetical protein CML21_00475 [Rheinheimera sp.]|nr:hypothetical protein [Rheinheimera sp.]|tara:strand:+ start:3310 stop:3669 length:360 start_codon:yes stop_codon:yes gene_type:complete
MKYKNKGLQRQLNQHKEEILELKAENEQLKKQIANTKPVTKQHLLFFILEAVVVVLLVSLGASAIENGLATLFYPCDSAICGELSVAGALRFVIGAFLILVAAGIILVVHISRDAQEDI